MKTLTDLDLDDPVMIKELLKRWDSIIILAEEQTKVTDLKIEIEQRWNNAGLSDHQARAIRFNLVDGITQDEVAKMLGFKSGRWISRLIEQGLEKLAGAN